MNNMNWTLTRESFDCSTLEKDRMVFMGKLLSFDKEANIFKVAFKIENDLMRMEMQFNKNSCKIVEKYKDYNCDFTLTLEKKEKYCLTLNSGYHLFFITEASLIKFDELEIILKYNLYDESSKQVISFNEIKISGESKIC